MSKYKPLSDFLRGFDRANDHTFPFQRIEDVLGFPLPNSARTHQAWWANQRNGRHVQANAWLDAGWHTNELDLKGKQVTFRPVAVPREPTRVSIDSSVIRPLTIPDAKLALALQFGVKPDDVEITIRG